jgi:hypothetical protein
VQSDLLRKLAGSSCTALPRGQREQARPCGLGERVVIVNGEGLIEHF